MASTSLAGTRMAQVSSPAEVALWRRGRVLGGATWVFGLGLLSSRWGFWPGVERGTRLRSMPPGWSRASAPTEEETSVAPEAVTLPALTAVADTELRQATPFASYGTGATPPGSVN
jgi:hypothetical protein